MLAPYCVNESFCSMLPRTIQQIDLRTILFFEELINTLTFYEPLDVVQVSNIEPLPNDEIELPLLSLATLVLE